MIHKTIFPVAKLFWGGALLFIDIVVKPTKELIWAVGIAVILDFITGIMKSKFLKKEITSEGFRKSVIKVTQYIIPVVILWGGASFIPSKTATMKEMAGWLMMFILYIEVTSVFENLYETDKTSMISKFLYKPALQILKFSLKNNPVEKAATKIKDNEKTDNNPGTGN